MDDQYLTVEELEVAEDLGLLGEDFDESYDELDSISQLRCNEEE